MLCFRGDRYVRGHDRDEGQEGMSTQADSQAVEALAMVLGALTIPEKCSREGRVRG